MLVSSLDRVKKRSTDDDHLQAMTVLILFGSQRPSPTSAFQVPIFKNSFYIFNGLLFSDVCFQVCPQCVCTRRNIITQVAFVRFFLTDHGGFSNVDSKSLDQSKQSHTGCICLTFLRCVFSNVTSGRLHKRMQSHIGCICLTYLQCAFSNVSSKWLHKSHTGCI